MPFNSNVSTLEIREDRISLKSSSIGSYSSMIQSPHYGDMADDESPEIP